MATPRGRDWTFLSNHGHVLVAVSRDPRSRLRDIAAVVGITERTAQGVLKDLEDAGYVSKTKVGRRNEYQLNPELRLRHPAESGTPISDLLGIFEP
jgi:DNA-binding MarR family transcriptional regulator